MNLRHLFDENLGYNYFKNKEGTVYQGWQYSRDILEQDETHTHRICNYKKECLFKKVTIKDKEIYLNCGGKIFQLGLSIVDNFEK